MNKTERLPLASVAALLALLVLPGCHSDEASGVETDTETNWLKACDTDSECGNYSCECGVCTTQCEADAECPMAGAVCSRAGQSNHGALCGEAPGSAGLCLDPNQQDTNGDDDAPDASDDDVASSAPAAPDTPEPDVMPEPAANEPEAPPPEVGEPDPGGPPSEPEPSLDSGVLPLPEPDDATPRTDAGPEPAPGADAGPEANACTDADADSCEPVSTELLAGYVLWDRPAGAAGTGPALELSEDGVLRFWQNTEALQPREVSDWEFETQLSAEQVDEVVRLLLAVDYADLPHETSFAECYPRLHFEGPEGELVDLEYDGASGLLPEMQAVYDWFDVVIDELAPDFVGPSEYCPDLP